jgi:hypothetical protein
MNYKRMKLDQLTQLATELGALPDEGSGKNGALTKRDLIDALTAGAGEDAVAAVAERPAVPARDAGKFFTFDRMYEVLKPFRGYEKGDRVCNMARAFGQALLDDGSIKLVKSSPVQSNPNARVKAAA